MSAIHVLTQYIWPDAAPTALYAEDVATRLDQEGFDVRLVGGTGAYRPLKRDKPPIPILHLDHFHGQRGSLAQTFGEYASVKRAFEKYIDEFISCDDIAIVTSAPPNSVQLATRIKRRGAHAIYWLQDYYPELIRGVWEYPTPLRRAFSRYWDWHLSRWDRIVKIGANLAGPKHNSVVIRNWPTMAFDGHSHAESKTALYLGNLGYGHDVDLFVKACARLRDEGYKIDIYADGRGVPLLPKWLNPKPVLKNVAESRQTLVSHEVHLIAAHPKIQHAIFPSKIWNSIALGRRLVCTGFAGEMARELEAAKGAPFDSHLDQWTHLVVDLANSREPIPSRGVKAMTEVQPVAIA
jgi:glycosyltransferase involved in cell wall biosynthesis